MKGDGAEELPNHDSWVQRTPSMPIPSRTEPICADMQEHQQGQEEWSDSEDLPPGFAPKAQADEVLSRGSTDRAKTDKGLDNFEAMLSGRNRTLWPGKAVATPAATAAKGPFSSLLALADAAVTGRPRKDLNCATNRSFTCTSDSFFEGNYLPSDPRNSSSSNSGSDLPQFSWIRANHPAQNSCKWNYTLFKVVRFWIS